MLKAYSRWLWIDGSSQAKLEAAGLMTKARVSLPLPTPRAKWAACGFRGPMWRIVDMTRHPPGLEAHLMLMLKNKERKIRSLTTMAMDV